MRALRRAALVVAVLVLAGGLACAPRTRPETGPPAEARADGAGAPRGRVERGKASYYAKRFHGRKTASGERMDIHAMTGAHRRLPFGTLVRVTNLKNGRSVVIRINDRGPYGPGRIVDVSVAAAKKLDMIRAGVVPATVEVVRPAPARERARRARRRK